MSDNNSNKKYAKSNHVNFTAVQGNDVEEGSTDDEEKMVLTCPMCLMMFHRTQMQSSTP